MKKVSLLIMLIAGCASFAPKDLRSNEPIELGDTIVIGSSETRYEIKGIDPVYYEASSTLHCENMHPDVPARCSEGGVCMAVEQGGNIAAMTGSKDAICMNDAYVNSVYRVIKRANLPAIRF